MGSKSMFHQARAKAKKVLALVEDRRTSLGPVTTSISCSAECRALQGTYGKRRSLSPTLLHSKCFTVTFHPFQSGYSKKFHSLLSPSSSLLSHPCCLPFPSVLLLSSSAYLFSFSSAIWGCIAAFKDLLQGICFSLQGVGICRQKNYR